MVLHLVHLVVIDLDVSLGDSLLILDRVAVVLYRSVTFGEGSDSVVSACVVALVSARSDLTIISHFYIELEVQRVRNNLNRCNLSLAGNDSHCRLGLGSHADILRIDLSTEVVVKNGLVAYP